MGPLLQTKMSYVKVTGKVPLRDDVTMATILNDMRGKGVQSEVVFEEDNITLPFETLMDKVSVLFCGSKYTTVSVLQ